MSSRYAIQGAMALVAAVICSSALAGGPSRADSRVALFQEKNIFHSGLVGTHTVALTFDDGPSPNTPGVLEALKAQNVKATFFIVGKMAVLHPDILAEIAADGHLLANHTASHRILGKRYDRNPTLLVDQIREVNDEISPLMPLGAKYFFRAPYGAWHEQHAAILNADPVLRNYIGPIYWDVGGQTRIDTDGYVLSSADWDCWHRAWTPDICAKGYMRDIRRQNGGVVLMHCTNQNAAALVQEVVPALVEEGYSFVRLDQVQAYDQYETPVPSATGPVVASTRGNQVVARTP